MSAPVTIEGRCSCGGPLEVRVGRKSTTHETTCSKCRRRWSYSCWTLAVEGERRTHRLEMFPIGGAE